MCCDALEMVMGKRTISAKLQIHCVSSVCVQFRAVNEIFLIYWVEHIIVF